MNSQPMEAHYFPLAEKGTADPPICHAQYGFLYNYRNTSFNSLHNIR